MFDGYIRDHASWTPRARAVITTSQQATYAQLDADVDRFGAALAARGVGPASGIVSVRVGGSYLVLVVTAALARLGVASSPGYDDAADLRITDTDDSGGEGPAILRLSRDEITAIHAAEPLPLPRLELAPGGMGRVMLSSGTTRRPRRVAIGWGRLDALNHTILRSYAAGRKGTWLPLTGIDSLMGFAFMCGAWSVGATITNPIPVDELPGWLEVLDPGLIGLTPIQLRQVLERLPADFQAMPAWRVVTGGAILPRALARETRLRLTPDIVINYGATEASVNALGFSGLDDEPGLVGVTPTGATLEIVDPEGRPLPDGQSGEIRIRGSRVGAGYIDDLESTAERFKDGWFHPGDIGRRRPDGRLVIEGRLDDRMNLGGLKFMPQVLEERALDCPGVLDAAAFAVPDPAGLEQCWLAISTVPGFDRDSLAAHLEQYPDLPLRRFAWVEALPRNAMGKVDREKLRDAVLAATRGD